VGKIADMANISQRVGFSLKFEIEVKVVTVRVGG
jgi:hypothetical protein